MNYWNGPLPRESICGSPDVTLPGTDVGIADRFAARVAYPPASMAEAFCTRMADRLHDAGLYWVSAEFTGLAISAAKSLPDLTISAAQLPQQDGLPVEDGLLVWQQPIAQVPLGDRTGMVADLVAANWSVMPQGVWITLYYRPEQAFAGTDRSLLRETLGWLLPIESGGGAQFGTHERSSADSALAVVLATWFLLDQPGVAEARRQAPDKAVARSYARQRRREPAVTVVDLRRRHGAGSGSADGTAGRVYRVRWMVRGFWRDQVCGPARSQRKRIFVSAYLKGPDGAPLKEAGSAQPVVVQALR